MHTFVEICDRYLGGGVGRECGMGPGCFRFGVGASSVGRGIILRPAGGALALERECFGFVLHF